MLANQDIKIGTVKVGELPRVVGTLTDPSLVNQSLTNSTWVCDLVEVRLDHWLPNPQWQDKVKLLTRIGYANFVTLRAAFEGGEWKAPESQRIALMENALEISGGIDVELQSSISRQAAELAEQAGKASIISFHDFNGTPGKAELEQLARRAAEFGSIVKISCMAKSAEDLERLEALIDVPIGKPICVIAMGSLGMQTRISFATKGSCLTYGYLDKPAAPGQLSSAQLVEGIKERLPEYRLERNG